MSFFEAEKRMAQAIASGVPDLKLGKNLFSGPRRAKSTKVPSRAVFVVPNGGPKPDAYKGNLRVLRRSNLLIMVRGDPGKYEDGIGLAREVRNAVHYADLGPNLAPLPSGVTAAVDATVNESEPVYRGEDDDGAPEWVMNAKVLIQELS